MNFKQRDSEFPKVSGHRTWRGLPGGSEQASRDRRSTSEPTARRGEERECGERGQVWRPSCGLKLSLWSLVRSRNGSVHCCVVTPNSESHFTYQDADSSITGASDMLLLKTHCSFNDLGWHAAPISSPHSLWLSGSPSQVHLFSEFHCREDSSEVNTCSRFLHFKSRAPSSDYLKHSRCEFPYSTLVHELPARDAKAGIQILFCSIGGFACAFCFLVVFCFLTLISWYFSINQDVISPETLRKETDFLSFTGDASSYQNIRMNLISSHLQENGSSPDMKMILK